MGERILRGQYQPDEVLKERPAGKEAAKRIRNHLRNAIKFNVEIWERR